MELSARTYALAGLRGLDPPGFDSVLGSMKPHWLIEPMMVLDSETVHWRSLQELMPELAVGRLTRIYRDTTSRPLLSGGEGAEVYWRW